MLNVLVFVVAALVLLLGIVVLVKSRAKINLLFFGLTSFTFLWMVSNFFAEVPTNVAMVNIANRLAYISAYVSLFVIATFTSYYPVDTSRGRFYKSLLYLSPIIVLLSFTSIVSGDVSIVNNSVKFSNGPLLLVYGLAVLLISVYIVHNLIVALRSKNTFIKVNAKLISFGLLFSILVSSIANIILPAIYDTYYFSRVGPLSTFMPISLIGYAIIKHRLFDIRLVVARSMAYILLTATVATLYGTAIFTITTQFFGGSSITTTQEVIYTGLAVFIAFTFQPLKKFFDKLTNKIFFRDNYDSEEFLNSLGKELSEQKNFTSLLQNSLILFSDTMKASRSSLVVLDEKHSGVIKMSNVNLGRDTVPSFVEISRFSENLLTVKDQLDVGTNLYQSMKKHNIDVILRLGEPENVTGYLLLAGKRGGNPYTIQDIKVLEITSKQLSVAIQNARYVNQIAEFNKTLQAEVKRATSKLEKSNEKLRHLDEAKDEFVSMASHQLRTPLTTIKGYLSMLSEGDAGEITKMQQKFVGEAFTATQRMVYLISDLLNVSRISTGKFVLNETTVDFAKIISEEVGQLNRVAETKDIKLEYKKPTNLPQLTLDKTKVSQVVMNFIDNALYYTPKKGKVVVELSETNTYIELTVTDNGIGVPKFEQHQLFTKFFRAENAREARPDGTGLGLYMAKKVIIAQGGSIIFESREGKGSTFGFRFPKSRVVASKNK